MDRALFLASRFLWPIHNLVFLAAVGIAFGQRGIADYTYALALCGPIYFLVGYSFPMFLLVDTKNGNYSTALLQIRIASAISTVPLFVIASLALPSTQANVVLAVWLVKIGEILFDPLPALVSADSANPSRGRRLVLLDLGRVAIAQGLMWYAMLGADWGIVRTLALVGGSNVLVSAALLAAVPTWVRHEAFRAEGIAALRRLFARATPMTISGALLALLVSIPRLLAEPSLSEHERAIFGVAQVLGTGAAVLFNSMWLYELHRIREDLAAARPWKAVQKNFLLSAAFVAALAAGTFGLALIQAPLFAALRISAAPSPVLPVLVAALGLQHCVSIHRDVLKFTGQQWREVQVIVQALLAATVTYYVAVYAIGAHWLVGVIAMSVVASAVQVGLSIVWLRRYSQTIGVTSQHTPA